MGPLKPTRHCREKIRKLSIKKRDTPFPTKQQQSLVETDRWLLGCFNSPISSNTRICRPQGLLAEAFLRIAAAGHSPAPLRGRVPRVGTLLSSESQRAPGTRHHERTTEALHWAREVEHRRYTLYHSVSVTPWKRWNFTGENPVSGGSQNLGVGAGDRRQRGVRRRLGVPQIHPRS